MTIWLVGAGAMAAAHAETLADQGRPFVVVGRSQARAAALAARHGVPHLAGGVFAALARGPAPDTAIVAVPVETLAETARALIAGGVGSLLLEKPAGLDLGEIAAIADVAASAGANVRVAYNRRFLASVAEARRRIAAAGGSLSLHVEFTELADRIAALPAPDAVKQRWVLANSSHVIDLAFHLCGRPAALSAEVAGEGVLAWHRAGAVFRGCGETVSGASFAYLADWRGPGRWRIEIVLPEERLILSPLETLQRVARGRFESEPVTCDDDLDRRFKPGLWRQMAAFLSGDPDGPPTIAEHRDFVGAVLNPIAGYASPASASASRRAASVRGPRHGALLSA